MLLCAIRQRVCARSANLVRPSLVTISPRAICSRGHSVLSASSLSSGEACKSLYSPLLASRPILRGYSQSRQLLGASVDQLKAGGLVDDLQGWTSALRGTLSVTYPEGSFSPGDVLSAPVTHVTPSAVSYVSDEDNSSKKYTLIMTDPDAPDRAAHLFREFIHYVVSDISAESLAAGGALDGTTVMDYVGVGAPHASGLHRYVFLLFEQPEGSSPGSLAQLFEGRGGQKAFVGAQEAGLGDLVAATWFESEWHESIDALHEALGFLPPPEFRSPKQKEANPK